MSAKSKSVKNSKTSTRVVNAEIFKQVYNSPHSLPGKEKWITSDQDSELGNRNDSFASAEFRADRECVGVAKLIKERRFKI